MVKYHTRQRQNICKSVIFDELIVFRFGILGSLLYFKMHLTPTEQCRGVDFRIAKGHCVKNREFFKVSNNCHFREERKFSFCFAFNRQNLYCACSFFRRLLIIKAFFPPTIFNFHLSNLESVSILKLKILPNRIPVYQSWISKSKKCL